MTVNYEILSGVLVIIIVLAFLLERALSLLFELNFYQKYINGKGYSPIIAFLVSLAVCNIYNFNALKEILPEPPETDPFGVAITAAIIAGGSKGALILMTEVLKIKPKGSK